MAGERLGTRRRQENCGPEHARDERHRAEPRGQDARHDRQGELPDELRRAMDDTCGGGHGMATEMPRRPQRATEAEGLQRGQAQPGDGNQHRPERGVRKADGAGCRSDGHHVRRRVAPRRGNGDRLWCRGADHRWPRRPGDGRRWQPGQGQRRHRQHPQEQLQGDEPPEPRAHGGRQRRQHPACGPHDAADQAAFERRTAQRIENGKAPGPDQLEEEDQRHDDLLARVCRRATSSSSSASCSGVTSASSLRYATKGDTDPPSVRDTNVPTASLSTSPGPAAVE